MKNFLLFATAAALVSGQNVAPSNPVPFNRGTPAPYDGGVGRGGQDAFGTHPIPLIRLIEDFGGSDVARYTDGQTPISGNPAFNAALPSAFPNARQVSNIVCGNSSSVRNTRRNLSSFHTFWGQFMDHDLGLTDGNPTFGMFPIDVTGDNTFPPPSIAFNRAVFINRTVTGGIIQREQVNDVTAWIDSSYIYGEDSQKAAEIRGRCALDTSDCVGQFVSNPQGRYSLLPSVQILSDNQITPGPINDVLIANPVGRVPDSQIRVSGDVRAQENNALESMHTLFMRDHNRCAIQLVNDNPSRTSDEIFEECRFFGVAYVQNILYAEYAPLLLDTSNPNTFGQNLDRVYGGFQPTIAPDVFTEFSGALFRYGHSELPTEVTRADPDTLALLDPIDLVEAFFNPLNTPEPVSIDQIVAGLWQDQQNEVDVFVVDDIRNQLFLNAGTNTGADLISFNLQRSRDHGLPSLNQLRTGLGLTAWASFTQLVGNQPMAASIAANLARVYTTVDDVELWIGGVAEAQFGNSNFGETLNFVISEQYQRFRVADNYYFENGWFSDDEVNTIQNTVLSTIILRNTMVSSVPCAAMTWSPNNDLMMCQNMFNSASSITFGVFTVFATLAAFFF